MKKMSNKLHIIKYYIKFKLQPIDISVDLCI